MLKRLLILIFCLAVLIGLGLITGAAQAADGPVGEIRWRWEGWNNLRDRDADTDDGFAENYLRSRLGYKGHIGDRGVYKVVFENNRVLGGRDVSGQEEYENGPGNVFFHPNDTIFLHNAVLGVQELFWPWLDGYVGRFTLRYGKERVIGAEDWSEFVEWRFDGGLLRVNFESADDAWLDLLLVKLAETGEAKYDPETEYTGDTDWRGLYFHYALGERFWFEPYALNTATANGKVPTGVGDDTIDLDNSNLFTLGVVADFESSTGLHLWGEAAFNTGKMVGYETDEQDGIRQVETEISAKGFFVAAEFTIDSALQPFLGSMWNFASGTKVKDEKIKTFYSPFASFSTFMGRMNLIGWSNTSSFDFWAGVRPVEGFTVKLDLNIFKLQSDEDTAYRVNSGLMGPVAFEGHADANGRYDKSVGTEFDLLLEYQAQPSLGFEGGLGVFSYGDYFKDPGAADQKWDSVGFGYLGAKVAIP